MGRSAAVGFPLVVPNCRPAETSYRICHTWELGSSLKHRTALRFYVNWAGQQLIEVAQVAVIVQCKSPGGLEEWAY